MLKRWTKRTCDSHAVTASEKDPDDRHQNHIGSHRECISRKANEGGRIVPFGWHAGPRANWLPGTHFRLYLARDCLPVGILCCPYAVANVGRLQLRAASHVALLSLYLCPELSASRGDDLALALA